MKKDFYVYPGIFTFDDDGISVEFPDLPGCLTCGDTIEEAIQRAKEAMGLHMYGMEIDGDEIPNPTPIKNIEYDKTQALILIEIYMPLYREIIDNQAVKKTLTIPRWLNILAEKNKVNFSQVLQNALKDMLNIKSKEI